MFGQFVNIPFRPPQEQGRGLDIAANIWDCPKPGPFSEAGLLTAPPQHGKEEETFTLLQGTVFCGLVPGPCKTETQQAILDVVRGKEAFHGSGRATKGMESLGT